MQSVRWVNVAQQVHAESSPRPSTSPAKKKVREGGREEGGGGGREEEREGVRERERRRVSVLPQVIETEPEPAHTAVDGSHRDLELYVSAIVDFAHYECSVQEVNFKDTLMYQSRVYR